MQSKEKVATPANKAYRGVPRATGRRERALGGRLWPGDDVKLVVRVRGCLRRDNDVPVRHGEPDRAVVGLRDGGK